MVKLHPHLQLQALLFLYTVFCILDNNNRLQTRAEPTYLIGACPKDPPLTPNSTYRDNLNALFPLLVSEAATSLAGFYQTSAGAEPTEIAYGLFLCRGDLSTEACSKCVFAATQEVPNRCESMDGTFWWDQCMLRHSYRQNFTVLDQNVYYKSTTTTEKVADPDRLERVLGDTLKDLAKRASNGGSGKKFAAGEAEYSDTEKLYGLAQCTPDLSPAECNYCLLDGISKLPVCCANARGAMVLFFSCGIRYEFYHFYNATTAVAPPPALQPHPTPAAERKGGISTGVPVAIIVAVCVSVLVLFIAVGYCFLSRKAKKKRTQDFMSIQEDSKNAVDDITVEHSLQYDLGTIQAATDYFSPESKIGQGGYGPVYKGILSDGEEIAVKRLSRGSGQGEAEFKNEVVLVAKLQHRNLVRILGFCVEAEERILIYEFMPNKSLDYLLFDPIHSTKLGWPIRYKIIGGIARGMLYLHEDAHVRVIHRDLKAANILLDGEMNAKVADFGMARIFRGDETHGCTSRVAGTFGYMSPEYFHGLFSVKSDAYSFGVLILEIISGKRNNSSFNHSDCINLTSYAWKLWDEGRPLDLIDQRLKGSYSGSEVTRCILIGLLCVQDDPHDRPSMATVVLMLSSRSVTLPVPRKPAFVALSQTGPTKPNTKTDSNQSTNQSRLLSVYEGSVTNLYPR